MKDRGNIFEKPCKPGQVCEQCGERPAVGRLVSLPDAHDGHVDDMALCRACLGAPADDLIDNPGRCPDCGELLCTACGECHEGACPDEHDERDDWDGNYAGPLREDEGETDD